jgi:transposase-like protein
MAPVAGVDTHMCPRCLSERVKRDGTWTVYVNTYAAYACRDCGGHWKTTFEVRGPSVKTL